MKLHLPKLLLVAVLSAFSFPAMGVAFTTADIKTPTEGGDSYLNVGMENATDTWAGDMVVGDTANVQGDVDKVGAFNDSWGFITPNGGGSNTTITSGLKISGNLTIQGSGKMVLGGQYKGGGSFLGLEATESITVTGGSLTSTKIVTKNLTVSGGTVSTNTGNCTSGNGYAAGPKQSYIKESLTISGGSLSFGYKDNVQGIGVGTHRQTAFGSSADFTLTQTGGTLRVYADMDLKSGSTISQSDGTMVLRDTIYMGGGGTTTINQSGDTSSLVLGRLETTGILAGVCEFDINQNGGGLIHLAYGSNFAKDSTINLTQTGNGTINIGGQHDTSITGALPSRGYALNDSPFEAIKTTYTIKQTGSGKVFLAGDAAITADSVCISGTLGVGKSCALTTDYLTLASGAQLDNNGIFTVGTGAAGAAGVLNVTTGGTLNLVLDGKNTAINVGAASADTNTVTGWTMATGSTLGIGFTSDYLGTLTTTEKEGVKTYDFTTAGVLVATDTNDSVDVTSFDCTLTGLDDRYWEWSDDAALSEDAQGNITLYGSLSFNPWVEVDEDNDHLDYVDDTAGGETGIIIKENVTLEGDNNHSLGTKIVGAEVELGHEDALGQSEIVTTSGTSQLSTADGVTANLSSEITVEGGDLTIKGSYKAAAGVLDEGLSQDAAYFCVDGNEGDNGFYRSATVEAHKVVEVEQGATLNVAALDNVLVTVDGEEYQLYDDGLAGAKLDYSEYHMNTEAHDVAASEILAAGTADTKVLMGSDAGTLTADTAIEVDAEGGIVQTTAAAEVSGSLDGVAIVAEGGEISATIGDDSSVLAQAGKTTITGANSYTGGTVIDNAELVVGHQEALGDGSIVLQNQGILDMGGYAVSNDLLVTGCTIKGAGAYTGNMTIQNPTQLDDATTATSVKLEKAGGFTGPGSLTTGSLEVATDTDASIEGSLTINDNGTVTLNDGKVLGVNGSLTLAGATTLTLNGDYAVGDKLLTGNDSLEEGAITLVYNDSTVELERIGNSIVLVSKFKQDKADMAAQSNWGIATASRAFVNTVRGQHSHTGCIGNGRGTVWAAVLGAYNDMDGADISEQGAAVGVDAKVGSRSTVGIAAGYTDGEVSPAGLRDVDQEGNYVALYGEHGLKKLGSNSCLSLDWVAAYGQTESKANGLKWEQDSLQLNTRLNWNKKMTDRLCMSVFGGLEYFATGSDTSEGVKSGSIQNLRGEIGVGARYVAWGAPGAAASYDEKGAMVTASRPGCEKLVLNGEIRYFNDMVRSNPVIEMDGLRGDGENPGRYGMGIEAGATYRIGERWSASANYSFNAMEDSTEHRVNVGASYTF